MQYYTFYLVYRKDLYVSLLARPRFRTCICKTKYVDTELPKPQKKSIFLLIHLHVLTKVVIIFEKITNNGYLEAGEGGFRRLTV